MPAMRLELHHPVVDEIVGAAGPLDHPVRAFPVPDVQLARVAA
jgi:hypothetical protein